MKAKTPFIVKLWLAVQLIVVSWDATYVLLRPRTMEGGDLFLFFSPYKLYITIDHLYANISTPKYKNNIIKYSHTEIFKINSYTIRAF